MHNIHLISREDRKRKIEGGMLIGIMVNVNKPLSIRVDAGKSNGNPYNEGVWVKPFILGVEFIIKSFICSVFGIFARRR